MRKIIVLSSLILLIISCNKKDENLTGLEKFSVQWVSNWNARMLDTITMTLDNYNYLTQKTIVKFDNITAQVIDSAEKTIKVIVPLGISIGKNTIYVVAYNGSDSVKANTGEYFSSFFVPVLVSNSAPDSATAGQTVTLTGRDFWNKYNYPAAIGFNWTVEFKYPVINQLDSLKRLKDTTITATVSNYDEGTMSFVVPTLTNIVKADTTVSLTVTENYYNVSNTKYPSAAFSNTKYKVK